MQKEPSYSISSSGFWKEFGCFPRVFNNYISMFFFNSMGSSGKKMPALHVCVREGKSDVWGRPVALSPVSRYWKIPHLWQPSCTFCCAKGSSQPCSLLADVFRGRGRCSALGSAVRSVCLPKGAACMAALSGTMGRCGTAPTVTSACARRGKSPARQLSVPKWSVPRWERLSSQGSPGIFNFSPPFFFFLDLRHSKNPALSCAVPSETFHRGGEQTCNFPCTVGLCCEANQCESVTNLTWIPSPSGSACCGGGSDTQRWSLDLPGAEHEENG